MLGDMSQYAAEKRWKEGKSDDELFVVDSVVMDGRIRLVLSTKNMTRNAIGAVQYSCDSKYSTL